MSEETKTTEELIEKLSNKHEESADDFIEEEIKEEDVAEKATDESEKEDPLEKLNEVEKLAYKQGWRPDGGEKSAEEFLDFRPFKKELSRRGSAIESLEKKVDALIEHSQKQQQVGYQKALQELKASEIEAIQMGDVEAVHKVREEMNELQKESNPINDPHIQSFLMRHPDVAEGNTIEGVKKREYLLKREAVFTERYPYLSTEDKVKILEEELNREFPSEDKKEPEKEHISAVEAPAGAVPNKVSRFGRRDLNDVQKDIYDYLKKEDSFKGTNGAKEYLKRVKAERDAGV